MEHSHLTKQQRSDRAWETGGSGRDFGKEEGMSPLRQRQRTPGSRSGCRRWSAGRTNNGRGQGLVHGPLLGTLWKGRIMMRGWKNGRGRRKGDICIKEVDILTVAKRGRDNEY